jgi:hypothetical protein
MIKSVSCFFCAAILLLAPAFAFAESPIPKDELDKRLQGYVHNTIKSKIVKTEYLQGSLSQIQKGLYIYPKYSQPIYFSWEGSYGQVVKEVVFFEYLKTGNVWVYNSTTPGLSENTVMVQKPTKPLPPNPAQPGRDAVKKILDDYAPEMSTRVSFTYEILSLNEPEFHWNGLDFEDGVYVYKGRTRYVKHHQGELLDMFGANNETWEADFQVTMTYFRNREKLEQDKRFLGDTSSGWAGKVLMDLKNAKQVD